jgi:hypothetical protein
MFRSEDIQARLREKPFRPFRFIASEGLQYDIRHPDLVFVGQQDITIGFATPDRPTVYDRVIRVALLHIVGMEDIPVTANKLNGLNGPNPSA